MKNDHTHEKILNTFLFSFFFHKTCILEKRAKHHFEVSKVFPLTKHADDSFVRKISSHNFHELLFKAPKVF